MPTFTLPLPTSAQAEFPALDMEHARAIARRRGFDPDAISLAPQTGGVDVISDGDDIRELVHECRRRNLATGLAPTMGALHAGHISLVDASRACCDVTIATIFVNPTQFAPNEDLAKYPRTLDEDLAALERAGADMCFVPSVEEMYPLGATTMVAPPEVSHRWEGEFRPTHFAGVATIVLKLFQLAPVDHAFFGQKDYQQALVIKQMVRDLKIGVRIHTEPIVRESDGLALSSRNRYLSSSERATALAVPRCLDAAEQAVARVGVGANGAQAVNHAMLDALRAGGIGRVDYAAIVDAETLEPLSTLDRTAVALVAAHVGTTRLIDNRVFPFAAPG